MRASSFTSTIFYRFFAPAVAASVCLGLANLADALFVGMMLGEPALAAISLVTPIYMVFNVLDVGLASGGAILFARYVGEGKTKKAVEVFQHTFWAALAVSVVLAVLGLIFLEPLLCLLGAGPGQGAVHEMTRDYALRLVAAAPVFFLNIVLYSFLRCDDGEKRAGIAFAVSNILDVVLSFVLVMIFRMEVRGAIWATILGSAVGVLIELPHLFQKGRFLQVRLVKPDLRLLRQSFTTGFATSSQYICQFFLFLAVNNLLIARHGENGVALFNLCLNISYLVTGLFDGVAATVQPLAATFHGERNWQAEQDTMRLAKRWGAVLGGALLVAVALCARPIAGVFGISKGLLDTAAISLRFYCVGGIGVGVSMILGTYWQAVGKEKQTMALTLMRSFGFFLLFAVPLAFAPLRWFALVFPLTELASLAVMEMYRMVRSASRLEGLEIKREEPVFQRLLSSGAEELSALLADCEAFCEEQQASMNQTIFATMAVEEMCGVIFAHGEKLRVPDVYIQITMFRSAADTFDLHIRDNTPAFDPFSLRTARLTSEEMDQDLVDNMGVLMVKKKAKEFSYHHYQGFNTLTVRI